VLGAALLGGCGAGDDGETGRTTPMPSGVAGVYDGEFPCSNCDAIDATLWLRPDRTFFLRQIFPAGNAEPETRSYAVGRWQWDESAARLVLATAGPERRLEWLDEQRLKLEVASPLEHVLVRNAASPQFTDRVRLDGESAIVDGAATFKECLSGLQLPVAQQREYTELRRLHRRLNPRGKTALASIEGRIAAVASGDAVAETLIVERVIDLRPGAGC
jgi:copper homeostasis protein (lipoprotein)